MSRQVCGICMCPYGDDGRCACPFEENTTPPADAKQENEDGLFKALVEARRWIGDGELSDGLAREYWTPEYAALIDLVDRALNNNLAVEQRQEAWQGLSDAEWMNIVNKNQAWFGVRPEEVAHEVCKLTEEKLREKNAGKPAAADKAGGDEPVGYVSDYALNKLPLMTDRGMVQTWITKLPSEDYNTSLPIYTRPQPQADVPEVGFGNLKGDKK